MATCSSDESGRYASGIRLSTLSLFRIQRCSFSCEGMRGISSRSPTDFVISRPLHRYSPFSFSMRSIRFHCIKRDRRSLTLVSSSRSTGSLRSLTPRIEAPSKVPGSLYDLRTAVWTEIPDRLQLKVQLLEFCFSFSYSQIGDYVIPPVARLLSFSAL